MKTLHRTLTDEQVKRYQHDGYLIVADLLSGQEIQAFSDHGKVAPKVLNLMGHQTDPQYRRVAHHPKIAGMAAQLLDGQPRIVQTMLLDKQAQGGQGIALHQDSHYLPNEPNTLMACWVALTDTDPGNGGLCVVPGSHRGGLRETHKARDAAQHVTWETEYPMRDPDGREWKQKMVSFEIEGLNPASIERLTVPQGAGVFFTGMTIHGSFANPSPDRPRRAFATHYVKEGTWLFRRDVQETTPVEFAG